MRRDALRAVSEGKQWVRSTIVIAGKTYRLSNARLDGFTTGAEIWISPDLPTAQARVETILHEGLHVLFPRMSEAVVARAARDLARLLAAFGEI